MDDTTLAARECDLGTFSLHSHNPQLSAPSERPARAARRRRSKTNGRSGGKPTRVADDPQADAGQAGPRAQDAAPSSASGSRADAADPSGEPETGAIIEALLFASDAPLSPTKLADYVGGELTAGQIREHVRALNEKYAAAGLSFCIEHIAKGYQMLSLPAFRPWIRRMNARAAQTRLSNAALETLAIIAYRQPIIRADIEAIRGVAPGETINRLRELGLVRVVGRADMVGRPMLYGTTEKFLDVFGLPDLKSLPKVEALRIKPSPPVSKPVDEVEPVAPAPIPPEKSAPLPQAAAGA